MYSIGFSAALGLRNEVKLDFLQNNRKSLAVAGDFTDRYDRWNHVNPTAPTLSVRINNRLAGW